MITVLDNFNNNKFRRLRFVHTSDVISHTELNLSSERHPSQSNKFLVFTFKYGLKKTIADSNLELFRCCLESYL